jgi:hypothetical protein
MINANASSARTRDKVIVTQRIPRRVLRDSYTATDDLGPWINNFGESGIPRGTIGRVHGKGTGRVYVHLTTLGDVAMVREFRDSDFEKYFAKRL